MNRTDITWSQRRLFEQNLWMPEPSTYLDMVAFEADWIVRALNALDLLTTPRQTPHNLAEFKQALVELIRWDAEQPTPNVTFLSQQANRPEFAALVGHFAVDGLTEAQSFLAVLPRVPPAAQMALQRILIDEFGCGNLDQMHTHLYCRLLDELGLPIDLPSHLPLAIDPVFEFVNIFHWMTKRAECPDYFLGALAWFEGVVPSFFAPYVEACERLGIQEHAYYTEHVHIDVFHARAALQAILETARTQSFDFRKAWIGVCLAREVAGRAFESAVDAVRGLAVAA